MIRLTLKAHVEPEIHLFNKSIILIGSDSSQVDLLLRGEPIQAIHLKIVEQNGEFFAINQINDPFAAINGFPFRKKLLKSGDVIQIHQIEIEFENLGSADKEKKIEQPVQQALALSDTKKNEELFHLPFEEEIEALNEDELTNDKLNQILKGTEPFQEQVNGSFLNQEQSKNSSSNLGSNKFKSSLKDDYLRDLEDENQNKGSNAFSETPGYFYNTWKKFLLTIALVFSLVIAVSVFLYYSQSGKTEAHETKAAQGVADIAMALTHAKLNELKPSNQNWSDGEFLRSNLQTIIPNKPSYGLHLDSVGQFNCCPYNLRIYTNRDLSRFLLIAQPAPSLFYWLIPQSIIVLDSEAMELRTFTDVRNINRLLANSEPLEGVNGEEISGLVKQGKLLRLSSLAYESNNSDFAPPQNIAWIKPGAENYIYNAPRYYRLGQNLLQKAFNLSNSKGTGQEVAVLKEDVANFSRLNDLVLYSENHKSAALCKNSIMLFAPCDKFLFGYLQVDSQGQIIEAHLLKEEEESQEVAFNNITPLTSTLPLPSSQALSMLNSKTTTAEGEQVDFNHPIYIHLKALLTTRENELRPLSAALYDLLRQELDSPRAHFHAEFQNLYHIYLITSTRHRQSIKEAIMTLYHQYDDMPINQFVSFLNAVHLNHLILQKEKTLSLVDENCIQNLENIFKHMDKCRSVLELDNLVHIGLNWLNFDYMKDPEELIKYQNLLRNHLLEQLQAFLLTNKKPIKVKAEDKEILRHLLIHERLIKPEEKDFFLAEFDELIRIPEKTNNSG